MRGEAPDKFFRAWVGAKLREILEVPRANPPRMFSFWRGGGGEVWPVRERGDGVRARLTSKKNRVRGSRRAILLTFKNLEGWMCNRKYLIGIKNVIHTPLVTWLRYIWVEEIDIPILKSILDFQNNCPFHVNDISMSCKWHVMDAVKLTSFTVDA